MPQGFEVTANNKVGRARARQVVDSEGLGQLSKVGRSIDPEQRTLGLNIEVGRVRQLLTLDSTGR